MDLKDIHDTILFFLNKEQNGYVSHEEIDLVIDKAQIVVFNQLHVNPKVPANAMVPRYGESQRLDDALSPFKKRYLFNSAGTSGGVVTLPTDFMYFLSMYTTIYDNTLSRNVYSPVQVLNEEELIERLESQIVPVSADDPIAIMNSQNKIQLFPEQPADGGVWYFKRPAKPVFNYTQSGRTVTYNQGLSTQLEWRDGDVMNIIVVALSYLGLTLSSGDIIQFAQNKEAQGQ